MLVFELRTGNYNKMISSILKLENEKFYVRRKNFKVSMPALKGKRKQLITQESNQYRFVTKNSLGSQRTPYVSYGNWISVKFAKFNIFL